MIYDNVQNEFLFYIFHFQHAGTNTVSMVNSRIEIKSSNMYIPMYFIIDIYHSSIILDLYCTLGIKVSKNDSVKCLGH